MAVADDSSGTVSPEATQSSSTAEEQISPLQNGSVAPGRLETLLLRFGVIGELLVLFATGKRWWMAPLVLLLGLFGLLLALINSFEVVAPFIYMAF